MRRSPSADARVILVVDDDPAIRSLCAGFLARLGHEVVTAGDADEALTKLVPGETDVVLTDLQMPGASGLDLLERVRAVAPEVRTILMSGKAALTDAATAIEQGVDRLLLKPFSMSDLQIGIEKALAEKRAQEDRLRDRRGFEELVHRREAESRTWILRAAHALAAAVEAKDAYTAGHAARVTEYALVIGEALDAAETTRFRLACDLHDVGKIGVPDAVLNKSGRLTDKEFDLVRRHPPDGARILAPLIDDPLVIGVVRWHHERWDGEGYPDGLRGEEIPISARVVAVADTLDAMTSDRAYRTGVPWEIATDEIRRCGGSQFDPEVVRAFERKLPELEGLFREFGTYRSDSVGEPVS